MGDSQLSAGTYIRLTMLQFTLTTRYQVRILMCIMTTLVVIWAALVEVKAQHRVVSKYREQLSQENYEKLAAVEDTMSQMVPAVIKRYRTLGTLAQSMNQDLSAEYLDSALMYFDVYRDDALQASVERRLAKTMMNDGKYEAALALLAKVHSYLEGRTNYHELAKVSQYLGDVKFRLGALDESLQYMYQANEYYQLTNQTYANAAVLNWLAIINNTLGDYKSTTDLLVPFVKDYEKGRHSHVTTSTAMLNLCIAYRHLAELDTAEYYLKSSHQLFFVIDSPRQWSKYYGNYYSLMVAKEDFGRANMYADTMIAYAELLQNDEYLSKAYSSKYYVVQKCCKDEDSASYLRQARIYADKSNNARELRSVYGELADLAIAERRYKDAIEYKSIVDSVSAILYTKDMATEVKRIEMARLKDKSEKEIALLEVQAQLKEENLAKQRKLKYGFVVFSIFLLGVVYVITKLLRRRNMDAQLLESKNKTISKALETNKMLIKEVHHRVKNNLQVVSSLLNLQSRYIDDELAREALSVGRSRVQSMSLLHQSLYMKDNVKQVDVRSYFQNLVENLFDTYKVDADAIRLHTDIDELEIDVDVVIPMGLICNELVSNALKYAFVGRDRGLLSLLLKDGVDYITLQVMDDGVGLPFETLPANPSSLGMKLIGSFTEKLEADLTIDNSNGSSFTLLISKKKIKDI